MPGASIGHIARSYKSTAHGIEELCRCNGLKEEGCYGNARFLRVELRTSYHEHRAILSQRRGMKLTRHAHAASRRKCPASRIKYFGHGKAFRPIISSSDQNFTVAEKRCGMRLALRSHIASGREGCTDRIEEFGCSKNIAVS